MKKSHELLFLNPALHKGVNVTIRNGDKWLKQAEVGDFVEIYKTGEIESGKMKGSGQIIAVAYLPCNMIPVEWLTLEHDSLCDTQHGLFKAMKRAYPEFKADDLVTVIMFDNTIKLK